MARKAERMLVLQNLKIEAKDAAAFNIYCRGLGVQYGPVNDLLFDLIPGGLSRGGSSFSVNLELAHNSKLKNRGALTYGKPKPDETILDSGKILLTPVVLVSHPITCFSFPQSCQQS
jgi:hypothetical protein